MADVKGLLQQLADTQQNLRCSDRRLATERGITASYLALIRHLKRSLLPDLGEKVQRTQQRFKATAIGSYTGCRKKTAIMSRTPSSEIVCLGELLKIDGSGAIILSSSTNDYMK